MMRLTAQIDVPNDWERDDVWRVLIAGLRAEVVIRWRQKHGKQSWPPEEAFSEVAVPRIKYPNPPTPKKEKTMQSASQEEKQPKLDRKTRGLVRRVTNKLRTIERRVFPSSSNPNRSYETVIYQDGQVLCNCQGWTMKKAGKPRQCRHTAELIGDRDIIDNGEYQFVESIAESYKARSTTEED